MSLPVGPPERVRDSGLVQGLDLAARLASRDLDLDETIARCADLRPGASASGLIGTLIDRADSCLWYAPRLGWSYATVATALVRAHDAADPLPPHLLARVELSMGSALAELGHFTRATPHLRAAWENLAPHGPTAEGAVALQKLVTAAIGLGRLDEASDLLSRWQMADEGADGALILAAQQAATGELNLARNQYRRAEAAFEAAEALYQDAGQTGAALLCWCQLAITASYLDVEQARSWLARARAVPLPDGADPDFHRARCDHIHALFCEQVSRYEESLDFNRSARASFAREGVLYLLAACDRDQGIVLYRLNRYQEALAAHHAARSTYERLGLEGHVAQCDLNIAIAYYQLRQYREALALFEVVSRAAVADGRTFRAAICYTNMGLCFDRLGRYDRALTLHEQARRAFLDADSERYAVQSLEHLAGSYRNIGDFERAGDFYREARDGFTRLEMPTQGASCALQMAELFLAMDQPARAERSLRAAEARFTRLGMPLRVATCHRMRAEVANAQAHYAEARRLASRARTHFQAEGLSMDIALCDLVEGEALMGAGELEAAQRQLEQARAMLPPALPDPMWRAEEALGQCRAARGQLHEALTHFTRATKLLGRARDWLPSERLSSAFFVRHRAVFERAIDLAVKLDAPERALALVESSKARSLLIQQRSAGSRSANATDSLPAELLAEERELRERLERARSNPQAAETPSSLAQLTHDHDRVVEQIQLLSNPLDGMDAEQFDLATFRKVATRALGHGWCCLSYFLTPSRLLLFQMDATQLHMRTIPLSEADADLLAQCTSSEPDRRELIYRGSLSGFRVPDAPGPAHLAHLAQLLLPTTLFDSAPTLLIIVPHGALHGLPFQALPWQEEPLIAHVPLLYQPSLTHLKALWDREAARGAAGEGREQWREGQLLLCGVSTFADQAPPLPHVASELAAVSSIWPGPITTLRDAGATVERVRALNQWGLLGRYAVLHLATHAVTDSGLPLLSRILLWDSALGLLEISRLALRARLVVLSACQAAFSGVAPGDEMMSLARAFFAAGASAMVGSLWMVEDETTTLLMRRFYEGLVEGLDVPQALQHAQLALHRAGCNPFQWAPFVAMGIPA